MKPSEEYTIHILEDSDFDMLPIGRPKEALGMSDAKRKVAWVRRTHVRDLDMSTINHEFDELMAKTSPHEIDGIRYKGILVALGKFIKGLVTAVKAGGAISGVGGGAAKAGVLAGKGLVLGGKAAIGAAVAKGATNLVKTGSPFGKRAEKAQLPGFAPQLGTSAFAPNQASATSRAPLSATAFKQGLADIDANRLSQRGSVFNQFRGQGDPGGNTAFSGELSRVNTSSAATRKQFEDDQAERQKLVGF